MVDNANTLNVFPTPLKKVHLLSNPSQKGTRLHMPMPMG